MDTHMYYGQFNDLIIHSWYATTQNIEYSIITESLLSNDPKLWPSSRMNIMQVELWKELGICGTEIFFKQDHIHEIYVH